MSIENHPNFNAMAFVARTMDAYYKSLRGKANTHNCPDVQREILAFATAIEKLVDNTVAEEEKEEI